MTKTLTEVSQSDIHPVLGDMLAQELVSCWSLWSRDNPEAQTDDKLGPP